MVDAKIDRKELVSMLELLRLGLGLELLRESYIIIFMDDRIYTVNEEVCISFPFEFESDGFVGAIPANEFIRLLSRMKSEEISITLKTNEMVVKGGSTSFGLNIKSDIEQYSLLMPEVVAFSSKKWKKIPEGFIDALLFCSFSCGTAAGMGAAGVCVEGKDILSSDGYRMSWCSLGEDCGSFAIPPGAAVELGKHELTKYYVDGNWIHFMSKGTEAIFSARLLGAEFPVSPKEFFPTSKSLKKVEKIELPEKLIETLGRVNALLYDHHTLDKGVTLNFAKKKLTCNAESKERGWMKEVLKLSGEVDVAVDIIINPELLLEILHHTRILYIIDDGRRVMFKGESFKHVLTTRRK